MELSLAAERAAFLAVNPILKEPRAQMPSLNRACDLFIHTLRTARSKEAAMRRNITSGPVPGSWVYL